MKLEQRALRFPSAGVGLIAIVDVPERPLMRGMLILPDSSQYRSGSHRQFTLLSRLLAGRGIAVMRFDRRGYGDSDGEAAGPGTAQVGEDIAAAMKEFFVHVPEMKEAVILAPGDAAPFAACYAAGDARVAGLALLDPLLPEAPAGSRRSASVPPRAALGPVKLSLAARLLRRAAARLPAFAAAPAPAPLVDGFGGHVLLVSRTSTGAGSTNLVEYQGPRGRRVGIAACPDTNGSAWREALALACASWITSW